MTRRVAGEPGVLFQGPHAESRAKGLALSSSPQRVRGQRLEQRRGHTGRDRAVWLRGAGWKGGSLPTEVRAERAVPVPGPPLPWERSGGGRRRVERPSTRLTRPPHPAGGPPKPPSGFFVHMEAHAVDFPKISSRVTAPRHAAAGLGAPHTSCRAAPARNGQPPASVHGSATRSCSQHGAGRWPSVVCSVTLAKWSQAGDGLGLQLDCSGGPSHEALPARPVAGFGLSWSGTQGQTGQASEPC